MPEVLQIDLDAQHPSYVKFKEWYNEMDDALEGQSAIVKAKEKYLPIPGGMKYCTNPDDMYTSYQKRASYPEITGPTVRGLVGVIHNEPTVPVLPKQLEPLIEKATVDCLTLESMARRITRQVLSMGRTGIAVTVDENGSPLFAIYDAGSIRNWNDEGTVVVLDESGPEMQADFTWEMMLRRCVLYKDEDDVVQLVRYSKIEGTGDWLPEEPVLYTKTGGNALETVPFVFIDTNDLTPEPDEVPLLPLARLAAKAYRQDANYQQTLYLSANPQFVITGMNPTSDTVPKAIGGGSIWCLPDTDQDAKILEFTGKSAEAQRTAIQDTMEAAIRAGARLFSTADEQQESGEARKIKYAAQTATLVGIALTVSAGVEQALKIAAAIINAEDKDIAYNVDTDFIDATIGAQEMTAIISGVAGCILSEQTGYELFQNGGRANPDRTWEDEKDLIDAQEPSDLGTLGRDADGNPIEEEEEEEE